MDNFDKNISEIEKTQLWLLEKSIEINLKISNAKTQKEIDEALIEIKELRGRNLNLKKDIDNISKQ